ncbi:MAG: secretin N-terminal domain-containing protein, partial [Alphaproteobacteria bacterium]|nr:secretin N-terminal domain-containing protein [Alphaproteobacteria bacterium]
MLAVSGCKPPDSPGSLFQPERPALVDPTMNLTQSDYNNLLNTAHDPTITFKTKGGDGGPPIPELAPILAAPQPPKIGHTKLVSIAVTDDVPLKDVLLELARLADVDIEVDATITGGIAFRAKDRPFNEVIERIAELAGLRYKIDHGVLRVERDTPYVEVYPVDFLNVERSTNSNINISTNVLSGGGSGGGSGSGNSGGSGSNSGGGSGGGGGLNTGSSSSISSKSESDFWKKLEEGITQILQYRPATMVSATSASPAARQAPGAAPTAAAAPVPAAPPPPGTPTERSFYILNRQGGTLTVAGTQRQQELIRRFIKKMERISSAQVLIEAKIVEVTLNREFQSGIDWTKIGGNKINFASSFGGINDNPADVAAFNFNLNNSHFDLNLAVKLAEQFGTTRTLSSPRLHAINNQQAVLTFAQNQVYFQVTANQNSTATTVGPQTLLTVNSTIQTVP